MKPHALYLGYLNRTLETFIKDHLELCCRVAFNLLALEKLKILNLHWNSMTHIDNSLLFNLSLMYNGGRGQLQTVTLYSK